VAANSPDAATSRRFSLPIIRDVLRSGEAVDGGPGDHIDEANLDAAQRRRHGGNDGRKAMIFTIAISLGDCLQIFKGELLPDPTI
jgi:hypothetical protein